MFSKHEPPLVDEYLCRWKIPGSGNLQHFFVDAVFATYFVCSRSSGGVKENLTIWLPDESNLPRKHGRTIRWTKILDKAIKTGAKVAIVGDLIRCDTDNPYSRGPKQTEMQHFRLTSKNAIMMSGQRGMSGDHMRIFEFCCGGSYLSGPVGTDIGTQDRPILKRGRYWIENFLVEFGQKHILEWTEKDLRLTLPAYQGRSKERERGDRSRSPKDAKHE